MKKSEFKKLVQEAMIPVVRKVVREELAKFAAVNTDEAVEEATTYLDESISLAPEVEKANYSISDILADTKPFTSEAKSTADRVQGGLQDALTPAETPVSATMKFKPVVGKKAEVIAEKIDADPTLSKGEKGVAKALTRDYRALMKKMNKDRGATRKTHVR